VFALPEIVPTVLHPERMDACAFVGVAPRGPARIPVVDAAFPAHFRMLNDGRPIQRSIPVPVRSFDEYVRYFGDLESPGALPQSVASFFEQRGKLAWIVRIVPAAVRAFTDARAHGTLSDAFKAPVAFLARNEGAWGNRLRVGLRFSTASLAFGIGRGGRIEVNGRAVVQPGDTLRLTGAQGTRVLAVCESLTRFRDATMPRERLVLGVSPPAPFAPARIEVVEAVLDVDDRAGRTEHFERLALLPEHPRSITNVLCERSALIWPHPSTAEVVLTPRDARLELTVATSSPFSGGIDDWGGISSADFFDEAWTPAEELPGNGVMAIAALEQATHVVVPDLYVPAQWAGGEVIEEVPRGAAGKEFGECVDIVTEPPASDVPPSALTGLVIDPRTGAGLDAIVALQQRVIDVCETTRNCIALLDVPPGLSEGRIEGWRARFDTSWAAAYHPWLVPARRKVDAASAPSAHDQRVPPSAVAAGIIAARELEFGIQYGPANEVARQIIHVAEPLPEGRADRLSPASVNCFARDPLGIALLTARTLSSDPDFRQLSVRRLMLMLCRTLLAQTQWAVFEPNGPALWRDLRHAVESLLRSLFVAGAFAGRSEAESFFVHVVTESQRLDRGELLIEVGVAPAEPLEFILVRLRRDGDGTLSLEE
jgi:hypothetical protein